MLNTCIRILCDIFRKLFNFLFSLEIEPGFNLGMIFIYLMFLSLVLFIIFFAISKKKE